MHEELLLPVYRRLADRKDQEGLIGFATEHRDYLSRCIADPTFVRTLMGAFAALERPRDEAKLFGFLVEREWSAPQAPLLYRQLIADAEKLADLPLMEKAAVDFLRKYPTHPQAVEFREQVGAIEYQRGNLAQAAERLSVFLDGRVRPVTADSLYYLGKSLDSLGRRQEAERAMLLFLAENRHRRIDSAFAPDAAYVAVSAKLLRGERKGARELLNEALHANHAGGKEPFLYKLAEVARTEGKLDEAQQHLQALLKDGTDPDWRAMATQALADIELRRKLSGQVKLSNR